jgi:hypothetical protein
MQPTRRSPSAWCPAAQVWLPDILEQPLLHLRVVRRALFVGVRPSWSDMGAFPLNIALLFLVVAIALGLNYGYAYYFTPPFAFNPLGFILTGLALVPCARPGLSGSLQMPS